MDYDNRIRPVNVRARSRRAGFRAAGAGYVSQSLMRFKVHTDNHGVGYMRLGLSETPDGSDSSLVDSFVYRNKIDDLSIKMNISSDLATIEVVDLFMEMRDEIQPGQVFEKSEMDKFRGRVDLQSMICNKIGYNHSSEWYGATLRNVFHKHSPLIHYTEPCLFDFIGNEIEITETNRLLHYMSTPEDVNNVRHSDRITVYSLGIKITFFCMTTSSRTRTDLAVNLNTSSSQDLSQAVHHLRMADKVTIGQGRSERVVPFVIENMDLDDGTVVMHLFKSEQGVGLVDWMEYCVDQLDGLLKSLLNTLTTERDTAYYSRGLGGSFPANFFRSLRGTIAAYVNEPWETIARFSNSVDIRSILIAYTTSPNISSLPMREALSFGNNVRNVEMFIKHLLRLCMKFDTFYDVINFNATDRNVYDKQRQLRVLDVLEMISKGSYNKYVDLQDDSIFQLMRKIKRKEENATLETERYITESVTKISTFLNDE
uniref:Uncharacterized protein n=1 Tax=viral metagenome TaxID=1070528 RepID=A0A2V0RAA6_9ZZZZ